VNQKQKEYLQRYQEEFNQLFPDMSDFANTYFIKHYNEFINAVDSWDEEPFPDGYIPHNIEVYYCKAHSPHIYIVDGVLEDYDLPDLSENNSSVTLIIDSIFAYIQIEEKEILNKLGGVILPEIITNPSMMLNKIIGRDLL
jgi:hypothetical protein